MAKQTGQITVLKNNKVTNVEHQIRFIFTKNNGERITRDTTDKGVINFDIPNGDWNVSWFAVDGDQKVLPLRAGLQLKITSSTPPTALADWIYGDNTHVADPILAQWTSVLDEMKTVRDEFRDETQKIGDPKGKFIVEAGLGLGGMDRREAIDFDDVNSFPAGFSSAYMINGINRPVENNGFLITNLHETKSWGYQEYYVVSQNKKIFRVRNSNIWLSWKWTTLDGDLKEDLRAERGLTGTPPYYDMDMFLGGLSCVGDPTSRTSPFGRAGTIIQAAGYSNRHFQLHLSIDYDLTLRGGSAVTGVWYDDRVKFLSDRNTIIDSNGNYKPASPVIQLHHDRVEYNEDFDKENPPQFEHLETGVYRITNVREICKDGWTYNKPLNGKSQPYFMIKYEQEDATTLLVRVFERTFDKNTGEFGFGEPRDIGVDERWIDFHFEIDHERIAREEAQMQKEQEEFEEQERLRKEAEDLAEAEANARYEAEMARQEAEMLAEMEAEHKEE